MQKAFARAKDLDDQKQHERSVDRHIERKPARRPDQTVKQGRAPGQVEQCRRWPKAEERDNPREVPRVMWGYEDRKGGKKQRSSAKCDFCRSRSEDDIKAE